ncbi:hypothetical protein J6590_030461 [Homalodisca vitripennis]|nr:hypothetical protein J6590_030461 [Homalodisca vitripennis]
MEYACLHKPTHKTRTEWRCAAVKGIGKRTRVVTPQNIHTAGARACPATPIWPQIASSQCVADWSLLSVDTNTQILLAKPAVERPQQPFRLQNCLGILSALSAPLRCVAYTTTRRFMTGRPRHVYLRVYKATAKIERCNLCGGACPGLLANKHTNLQIWHGHFTEQGLE